MILLDVTNSNAITNVIVAVGTTILAVIGSFAVWLIKRLVSGTEKLNVSNATLIQQVGTLTINLGSLTMKVEELHEIKIQTTKIQISLENTQESLKEFKKQTYDNGRDIIRLNEDVKGILKEIKTK